jgi:HSP20 family protein
MTSGQDTEPSWWRPGCEGVTVVTISFDPFRELDRLSQMLGGMTQGRGPHGMPMDLYRSGDHYVINVDLPGADPGSIDVSVEGNTLTIRSERTLRAEGEAQWLAQERLPGSFMRQLTLDESLDVDAIHATYENGVLSMTIPVSSEAKPRRIQVESRRGGPQQVGQSEQPGEQTVQGETTSGEGGDQESRS